AGHSVLARESLWNWALLHACRALAPEGFRPMPRGSETSALRRCDSLWVSPPLTNGSVVSTVGPAGESTWVAPGETSSSGSNGTLAQPTWTKPEGSAASTAEEPTGKLGFGSSRDEARKKVE